MIWLTEVSLCYSDLPEALEGLCILHIGDLHTRTFGQREETLCRIIRQGADIVICSGDFCHQMSITNPFIPKVSDGSPHIGFSWAGYHFPPDIPHALLVVSQLVDACESPLGFFVTQGNHDPDELMCQLPRYGITVLANTTAQIDTPAGGRFNLCGLRCLHRNTVDIPQAMFNLDPTLFTLCSCHYPELVQPLAAAGINLILAGHTHGGQVCLPGGTPLQSHSRTGRLFVKGLQRIGDHAVYTTRGLGYSLLPIRTFCPPELTRLTLHRAPVCQTTVSSAPVCQTTSTV